MRNYEKIMVSNLIDSDIFLLDYLLTEVSNMSFEFDVSTFYSRLHDKNLFRDNTVLI